MGHPVLCFKWPVETHCDMDIKHYLFTQGIWSLCKVWQAWATYLINLLYPKVNLIQPVEFAIKIDHYCKILPVADYSRLVVSNDQKKVIASWRNNFIYLIFFQSWSFKLIFSILFHPCRCFLNVSLYDFVILLLLLVLLL